MRIGLLIFSLAFMLTFDMGYASEEYLRDEMRVADSFASGGTATVNNHSREAFARPLPNLPTVDLRKFTFGNKMFNTNWVQAPASVTSLDGLGPMFNRVSCSGCHFKDGRGRPPRSIDEPMNSMLLRLSVEGRASDGGPKPHPLYGGQLNPFAIQGVKGEGKAIITYEVIYGQYDDGTPYSLRKPTYHFTDMAYGEIGAEMLYSPRVAPAVFGLGLLEAISLEDMLRWADESDEDGDGISGRPNYVPDMNGKKTIGKFGWKANVATLHQQDAGAAIGDMGITTSDNMQQNCTEVQEVCLEAATGGEPEMSDMQLERMVFYSQTLAVPARRKLDDLEVKRGAELFMQNKCVSCHIPQVRTGGHAIPALSHQKIQPFTDLLLHDMGEGLADNRPDYEANGNEWRTPPLWGIGLVKTVNKHSFFLHDGRARNLEEAILWHGGEGEASRDAFKALNKKDRKALVAFLKSL